MLHAFIGKLPTSQQKKATNRRAEK